MRSKIGLFLLVFTASVFGFAGEKENVGLLFKTGAASNVGAVFQLSERFSLRTTLGFSTQDAAVETTSLFQGSYTQEMKNYTAALGLFYHFREKEKLSLYSGLEFGYSHTVVDSSDKISYQIIDGVVIFDPVATQERDKRHGYTGNVILGVKYRLGKRFAIFGEIGLGFEKSEANNKSDGISIYNAEYTDWNLKRSGIGIIFFL